MKLSVRLYNPTDYETMARWLKARDWPEMPEDMLPKIGAVAEVDGKPVFMAFMYRTDSSIAWFAFPVSDPDSDHQIRARGLNAVVDVLKAEASTRGYKTLLTTSGNDRLNEKLAEHGFIKGDENVTQMVWRVG